MTDAVDNTGSPAINGGGTRTTEVERHSTKTEEDVDVRRVEKGQSPPIHLEVEDEFNNQDFHLSYEAANALAVELTNAIPDSWRKDVLVGGSPQ